MDNTFQEMITAVPSYVNVSLLVGLMALGYVIKHTSIFGKVSNKLIPVILAVTAILAITCTSNLATVEDFVTAFVSGLVNAAVAVYVHETGKNIFEMLNVKRVMEELEKGYSEMEENKEE